MSIQDNTKIQITLDGDSASGKGTAAKEIAKRADIPYIAGGLIYRLNGYLIGKGVCQSVEEVGNLIKNQEVTYGWDGKKFSIHYQGKDISDFLESSEIAKLTPDVVAKDGNATKICDLIRSMGENLGSFVMDGRNIGTTIFPEANHKFYMTTNPYDRSIRRLADLRASGEFVDLSTVYNDLKQRDLKDKSRKDSPMTIPDGAIVIDTTGKSRNEVLLEVFKNIPELKKQYQELTLEIRQQSEISEIKPRNGLNFK
jgi:CMP/dCMP kinase